MELSFVGDNLVFATAGLGERSQDQQGISEKRETFGDNVLEPCSYFLCSNDTQVHKLVRKIPTIHQRKGGGKGGVEYLLVPCPSPLTTHHVSLSRWSIAPTAVRDISNIQALITVLLYVTRNSVNIVSPFYCAACGHHISPRIAIMFLL